MPLEKTRLPLDEISFFLTKFYKNKISSFDAALTADTISKFEDLTWDAFQTYRTFGQEPLDLEISGFTYVRFRDQGCDLISALINLDWLLKEPKMANAALTRLDIDIYHQTLF